MKCPQCNKEGVKYIQRLPDRMKDKAKPIRTDFNAKCKYCDWEGLL